MRTRSASANSPDAEPTVAPAAPPANAVDLAELLVALRPEPHLQTVPRADVIDGLLDLRLAAATPLFTDRIDRALIGVPGRTTTSADWWRDELDLLEVLAGDPVIPPSLAKKH